MTPEYESPSANKFVRLAGISRYGCIGFLGFLGFLGFIPGWERLFGLYGLFGFTGLFGFSGFFGVAHYVEQKYLKSAKHAS